MGLSYVLLLMGLFYVQSSLYYVGLSYVYTKPPGSILCIAPPILHKMVLIYIVIDTIMGPSYVHRLLWGLTLVHKMVSIYIES